MPYDLEAIIQHVRSQGRSGTHQAVLLGRIDELEAEVARLRGASTRVAWHPSELLDHLKAAIRNAKMGESSEWLNSLLDDQCCHKTRMAGAGCPIGRKCPHVKETTDV